MKYFVSILLFLLSTSAMSDQLKIQHDDNITGYVYTENIKKNVNITEIPILLDFKEKVNGKSSAILVIQYNCTTIEQKLVLLKEFNEHMGIGEESTNLDEVKEILNKWFLIPQDSLDQFYFTLACNK